MKAPLIQVDDILQKINYHAKIGIWQFDYEEDSLIWNSVINEIAELPPDFIPSKSNGFSFYKEGKNRALFEKAYSNLKEKGEPFDIDLEILTAKGNTKHVRTTGQADFENGVCIRSYGIFEDITLRKENELRLTTTVEQLNLAEKVSNSGYWSWNTLTNQVVWSKQLYHIFQIPTAEVMDHDKVLARIHPDDRSKVVQISEDVLKNKRFQKYSYRIVLDDGTERTIELSGKVITDSFNEVIEVAGAAQDITEQKAIENDLTRKNEFLSFSEKLARIGYWQWNTITNEIFFSDILYDTFGLEPGTKIMFDDFVALVHPEDRQLISDNIQLAFNGKKYHEFPYRILLKDGTIKTLQLLAVAIGNKNGAVNEISGTLQDITLQKKTETELIRKNEYLTFVENLSKIGYWQWDVGNNNIKWSDMMYTIFEHEPGTKIVFDTYFNYIHPEDQQFVSEQITLAFQGKKYHDILHRIVLKNGSIKTIQLLAVAITNPDGEVIEISGTLQDVTMQRMEEIKFKNLLESAPDAMIIVDKKGIIQITNKQSETLFGMAAKDLVGLSVAQLTPQRQHNAMYNYAKTFFEDFKHQKLGFKQDFYVMHNGRNEVPAQLSLSPLFTEDGPLVIIALRDITELKKAEKQLLKANKDLQEYSNKLAKRNNQLAEFNHITSHNLRSPVSNLNMLLELHKEETDELGKAELFEKFEMVIDHLTLTLNTLVESIKAKSEGNKNVEKITLAKTVKNTKEILAAEIINSNATIKVDFSNLPCVEYNKIYLDSIFLNLIGNAIKYRSKHRPLILKITSEIKQGRAFLSFEDNGLGIDLKMHGHKVFGLNKVFHRHPEAKGVGLFLTKSQVEAMGGYITIDSEIDKGTKFEIDLNYVPRT